MSAITGFMRLDGASADLLELIGMSRQLAHRGEAAHHIEGRVALAGIHHESPALVVHDCHVIAADARIDNRKELSSLLGLSCGTTDVRLIAAAYDRWGERCVDHLIGDFAFVICDERRGRLFCARDHLGARPFYYFRSRDLFAFSTEIKGLLALSDVPGRISDSRIADYLMPLLEDHETTFYEDILRLPAAHCMSVSFEGGVHIRRYWELDPEREIRCNKDEEYAEAFREIFFEAVRCRLDASAPNGSMLSGGLDSSSIVSTARSILSEDARRLHTFSARFPDVPQCDEGYYIHSVVAGGGVVHHDVPVDSLGPLSVASATLGSLDEPMFGPNTFFNAPLYEAARAAGVRVMLDGTDGDTVVSHGITFLDELARSGRWLRLGREVIGLARNLETPITTVLRRRAIRPLIPATLRARYRRLRGEVSQPWVGMSIADAELERRTHLHQRAEALLHGRIEPPRTAREYHLRGLQSGLVPLVMEELNHVSALYGIEPRYPFFDKRLVEFCLALPGDQKIHRGWTRVIMRRAMAGVLPEEVRRRRDKGDLSMNFRRGLLQRDRGMVDTLTAAASLDGYVDREIVRHLQISSGESARPASDAVRIWRGASLSLWLQRASTQRTLKSVGRVPANLESI